MENWTTPCGCLSCIARQQTRRPVPTYSTLNTTSEVVRERAKQIVYAREHIQQCLRVYGDVILTSWDSKTPAQRKSVLKSTLPDIPSTHRPEFEHQQDAEKYRIGELGTSLQSFDTPQLNIEDLSLDGVLLALLRSRGEIMPFEFIVSDLDNAGVALEGHATMKELEDWRVVFDKTSYGKFALTTELEEADIDYLGLHPLSAVYALGIQRRLLSFLSNICKALSKERGLETTMQHLKNLPDCAPYADLALASGPPASLRNSAVRAETQLPCSMSIKDLLSLVESRASQARDNVLSLVGDAGYFVQHLRDQEAHIPEVPGYLQSRRKLYATEEPNAPITAAMDSKNKAFACLMTGFACSLLVMSSFRSLILWMLVVEWTDKLGADEFRGETCRTAHEKYPREVEKVLCHIQHHLQAISKIDREQLAWAFPASAKMRKFFDAREVLEKKPDVAPTHLNTSSLRPTFDNKSRDPEWAFHTIKMLAESEPGSVGYRCIMSEMENVLTSKRSAIAFVSPFLRDQIANILVSGKLHEELRFMWPASAGWEEHNEDAQAATGETVVGLLAFCRIAERVCTGAVFRSSDLQYPEAEPDSEKTRTRRCQTEDKLNDFWQALSKAWDVPGALPEHILEPLRATFAMCENLRQTEPWVARDSPVFDEQLKSLAVDEGTTSLARLLTQKARVKAKTRPLVPVVRDVPDNLVDREEDIAPLMLSVDATTYQVFDVIFNMTQGAQPGELAWTAVERALCSIGFDAVRSLDGSAVRFSPSLAGIQGVVWTRSITLHHPHPKAEYAKAQIYRLRGHLQRAFDLGRQSFILRE